MSAERAPTVSRAEAAAKKKRLDAYRQSAALIPAWRSALARAVRRHSVRDAESFANAAMDVGLAHLDRGIATSRRSLDRLMDGAFQLHSARQLRKLFRRGRPAPYGLVFRAGRELFV